MVRVARKPRTKPAADSEPEVIKSAKAIIIKTTEIPTKELQVYHRNPRVGDLGKIAESLEANGQFRPILVNLGKKTGRRNEVLAGNHTFLAARHLGWETITASLIDVDDNRARAIVLADNATAEAGTYDAKELAELVQEARDAGVVEGIGFDEDEMNAILKSVPKINNNDLAPPTISLHELGIDTKPKDKREKMLEQRNAIKDEANRNRGNSKIDISEDTDIEDLEEPSEDRAAQLSLARVQAQLELMEGENWFGNNEWQIPDLREDMLVESVPEDVLCWAGNEATPDDGQQWFIYNYSLGGMKGLPIDRTILSFFTHDDKFAGWWDLPAYYCMPDDHEALTQRGWLPGNEVTTDDVVLTMNPQTKELVWSPVREKFRKQYFGPLHRIKTKNIDAEMTPGHRWVLDDGSLVPVESLTKNRRDGSSWTTNRIITMGEAEQSTIDIWQDAFVEVVGWAVTEGHYRTSGSQVVITQKPGPKADRIAQALKRCKAEVTLGWQGTNGTIRSLSFGGEVADYVRQVAPNRVPTMKFLLSLSAQQRQILFDAMIDGDGCRQPNGRITYAQKEKAAVDSFITLCTLLGYPTTTVLREPSNKIFTNATFAYQVEVKRLKNVRVGGLDPAYKTATGQHIGHVWCPVTDQGSWVCRHNGKVFVTGNTAKMLVQGLTQAICPDNSFYFTLPRVLHLRGVYQSQWMGRFFQEAGIKVIPRIQFDDLESLKFNMLGIPKRPPVIATSLQNFEGTKDERTKQCRDALILMQNCVDKLRPTNQIIVYGGETLQKQLHILDGRGAQVIGVRNYVSMRRGTAFDKKEGAGGLSAADKKRIRSEVEADAESNGRTIRRRVKIKAVEAE